MKKGLIITLFLLSGFYPRSLFAQEGTDEVPELPVPIDGGVSLLAAAGIAYGIKRLKDVRTNHEKY